MTLRSRGTRFAVALTLLASLGGCGLFGHHVERGPKTAVLGNRVSVLNTGSDAVADPSLADVPVVVPAAVANDAWTQPGGNAFYPEAPEARADVERWLGEQGYPTTLFFNARGELVSTRTGELSIATELGSSSPLA